jgi:hypothetical protein
MFYMSYTFLIVFLLSVVVVSASEPDADIPPISPPILPIVTVHIDGVSAKISHNPKAIQDLLYVCNWYKADNCAEFFAYNIAKFIESTTHQVKTAEREKACQSFLNQSQEEQTKFMKLFGGYNPCKQ